MSQFIGISMTVITDDEQTAVKVWEVIGRAAVGLALEGITVSMNASKMDDEDEGE